MIKTWGGRGESCFYFVLYLFCFFFNKKHYIIVNIFAGLFLVQIQKNVCDRFLMMHLSSTIRKSIFFKIVNTFLCDIFIIIFI